MLVGRKAAINIVYPSFVVDYENKLDCKDYYLLFRHCLLGIN